MKSPSVDRAVSDASAGPLAGPTDVERLRSGKPALTGDAAPPARLARNISVLAASQFVNFGMGFVWTLVVPRLVGPAGMGRLVTAWSATAILGVLLGLGTRQYLVRECVSDPDAAAKLVGTAVVVRICLTPLFVAAVAVYISAAGFSGEQRAILYFAAGATLLTLLAEPILAVFQAIERMEYLAFSDAVMGAGTSVVGVVVAVAGCRAVGITASWCVVAGIVLVLNVLWLRPHLRVDLRTDLRRMRSLVTDSLPYLALGVFYMTYLWIDSVILAAMTPPQVVGWYGVPTKLFQALVFIPVILSTAWLPRLVTAFGQGPDELRAAARAPLELVGVLSLPICVATAMTAGPVIRVLYGSPYRNAAPVLVILGFCLPPMYINIMLNQVLVAAKRQVTWTWVMAGATVVNPILNVVLIPLCQRHYHNGAVGAALSMLLTELLVVFVGFVVVGRRLLGISSVWRFARAALAAAAMWGVGHLAAPVGWLAAVVAGSGTFLTLAAVLRLATREELELLMFGLRRLRPGSGRSRAATRPDHTTGQQ